MDIANAPSKRVTEENRVSMSTPERKLEVPEREGFRRFWFLDQSIPRALAAGYEYVDSNDVTLNQHGVGNDSSLTGNQDLGSRVKLIGGTALNGQAEYLTLMEIRLDWWQKDQKVIENRNASIMAAIFKGEMIAGSEQLSKEDRELRYVNSDVKPLFQRPTRKAK